MQTMRRSTWVQACVGLAAVGFASSAAAQGRGPGPFAGSFTVSSSTTVSVTSPMAITEERTTRERLEISQGSRSDLNVQVTNDLGEHCTLTANRSGDSGLSFGSGQRCTFTDSVRNMRMNFTLRSGSGSISGDRLSLSFSWNVASNGGFLSVSGSASQHSAGSRTGGRAVADNVAPVVEPVAPMVPVAPSFPAAVVPVSEPAVAPMMPMTGTPTRVTTRRTSTGSSSRPRATAPAPTPVVAPAPTPTVAVAPSLPVAPAPSPAPAAAWGSPSPSPQPAPAAAWGSPSPQPSPVATSWTTPPANATGWGAPSGAALPIDANTPGAVVLPSGWILGPLLSSVAAAVPVATQAVSSWSTPQQPTMAPSVGVPWGSQSSAPAATGWTPAPGGPGVVLGAPGAAPSQGFGVTVTPSSGRPMGPTTAPPGGTGPGLVFGATR